MQKKIFSLVLSAIMLLGIFNFAACGQSLDDYKATKQAELQDYANTKCAANSYCMEGLAAISAAVTDGKAKIDKATSHGGVDTAYKTATDAVDAVAKEEVGMGKFYTLQEAYNEGLLAVADLQSIATHHTDRTSASDILHAGIVSAIKEVAALNARENEQIGAAKAEDFRIEKYYGSYNGSVAIMLNHPYCDYPAVVLDVNETIAGVVFHYSDPNRIIVWNNKI